MFQLSFVQDEGVVDDVLLEKTIEPRTTSSSWKSSVEAHYEELSVYGHFLSSKRVNVVVVSMWESAKASGFCMYRCLLVRILTRLSFRFSLKYGWPWCCRTINLRLVQTAIFVFLTTIGVSRFFSRGFNDFSAHERILDGPGNGSNGERLEARENNQNAHGGLDLEQWRQVQCSASIPRIAKPRQTSYTH